LSPFTYDHPRPSVTVDIVVFSHRPEGLAVLLVQRGREPFKAQWALPGGFIEMDEPLEQSAKRELEEETGLQIDHTEQIGAYGDPHRDPRGRVISIAFWSILPSGSRAWVAGSDDASHAEWFPISDLPSLAFDHKMIIQDALKALRARD
jgi:8-oxo-dGTP diphosphatase